MKKKLVLYNPPSFQQGLAATRTTCYPPLGLGMIAACTPSDWEVVIRDYHFDEMKYEPCDLAGISSMTCQINNAYKLAKAIRGQGVPVVMGGIHPTMRPQEALNYCDAVVKGEAEHIWGDVIKDFNSKKLKKIYEKPLLKNLDNLPDIRYDLFNENYKWSVVQTTRGCPFNCEFCSVTVFTGKKYRKRPINNVLDELARIPQQFIFFGDDNLLGYSKEDIARFEELCEGMIKRGVGKRWISQVSANFSEHERAMKLAKEAGCMAVFIGIESVSTDVLNGNMNKKHNLKYVKNKNFIKNVHKHGIVVIGSFIVGSDEDGPDCFERTRNAIKRLHIDVPTISFLSPMPGTKLWQRLESENRIPHSNFPEDWDLINGTNKAVFATKNLTKDQLNRGLRWITRRLYTRFKVFLRALRAYLYSKGDVFAFNITINANKSWGNRHKTAEYFVKNLGKDAVIKYGNKRI
jgi:radical SAM superfamily enzyme YgiQ (UPF0313 family)